MLSAQKAFAMPNDLYVRVLYKTAALLGGKRALALFLNVRATDVKRWLDGSVPVPVVVLLACMDRLVPDDQYRAPLS